MISFQLLHKLMHLLVLAAATYEKERIFAHHSIDMKNELAFLQQEVTKKFFTKTSEKDLYDNYETGSGITTMLQRENEVRIELRYGFK